MTESTLIARALDAHRTDEAARLAAEKAVEQTRFELRCERADDAAFKTSRFVERLLGAYVDSHDISPCFEANDFVIQTEFWLEELTFRVTLEGPYEGEREVTFTLYLAVDGKHYPICSLVELGRKLAELGLDNPTLPETNSEESVSGS